MPLFSVHRKGLPKALPEEVILKVYSTPWKVIGAVSDFIRDEPQVVMLEKNLPVYVLRVEQRFRVFDMSSGGEYEWKLSGGQVMIRRRYADNP